MRKVILFLILGAFAVPPLTNAQTTYENWPTLNGSYMGQKPPGMTSEIFGAGFISTDKSQINSVFSPSGDEFYFTTWTKEAGTKIEVSRLVDGRWTAPKVASFSLNYSNVDPALSHDGQRVYFSSRRPRPYERPSETEERKNGFDLWFADRTGTGWSKEKYLGPVVNSGKSHVYSTATKDGSLYFQAQIDGGYGKADIYKSQLSEGVYQKPVNLGPVINSANYEGDVFIAPDESYLIVSISGRSDSLGSGDLYISFRAAGGSWLPLKNMGGAINSNTREFCPMLSPDGKYFFFTSKQRGQNDIYWVDAKLIDTLRD